MRFDFDECTFSRHTLQKSCPGQWAIALVSDYQRDGSFVLSGADLLLQYTFRTAKGDKTKHEHTNIDWSRFAQDTHVIRIDLHPEDDPKGYAYRKRDKDTQDIYNEREPSRHLYIWNYEGAQYLAFNSPWAKGSHETRRTFSDPRPWISLVRIVSPGVFEYASYRNVKGTCPLFNVARIDTNTLTSCGKTPSNPQLPGLECPTLHYLSQNAFWDAVDQKDDWVDKQHWPELAKAYASMFHVDLVHGQYDPWRRYPGSGWRPLKNCRRTARLALFKWIAWLRKRQLHRLSQLLPSRKRERESGDGEDI